MKRKRKKMQINKIRDQKGDITTNTNEIQRIFMDCAENLFLINWKFDEKWINFKMCLT
jgi:hypothetical protein